MHQWFNAYGENNIRLAKGIHTLKTGGLFTTFSYLKTYLTVYTKNENCQGGLEVHIGMIGFVVVDKVWSANSTCER